MKTGPILVAALFALTSFPFFGQQPPSDSPPNSPAAQKGTPPDAQPTQPAQPEAAPGAPGANRPEAAPDTSTAQQAPAPDLRPVNGELVSALDTKTAKTGDSVVVQTKSSVKTADGTEIPKGSKLVGKVLGVQPSAAGANSQVALQFDHAELTGGQTVPIRSEIQSIAPAGGSASDSAAASGDSVGTPSPHGTPNGAAGGSAPGDSATAPGYAPGYTPGTTGSKAAPAPGTVVARNGKIAIRTTSVPGVLLANNAPGEQDPRMEKASGILLGAQKDVQLDGGTQMVLGVSATGGGSQ